MREIPRPLIPRDFGDGEQRGSTRQPLCSTPALCMSSSLEALYLGAVYQRGMRRRQFLARPQHGAFLGGVETAQRALQNAAPLEIGGVQAATECIEHRSLMRCLTSCGIASYLSPATKLAIAARMRISVDDCDMRTMEKLKGRRKMRG